RRRTRACAPSSSAMIRSHCCARCRTAFPRRSSSAAIKRSTSSWPRSSALSRRRHRASTSRSTSAARRSNSGCGRRFATSRRARRKLSGTRQAARHAQSRARGGTSVWREWHRRRYSLPPGGAHRWVNIGLSLGRCAQARFAGTGEGGMTRVLTAERVSTPAATAGAPDWTGIAAQLDSHGCATTGALLTPQQCAALVASYASDALFRSRVVMARHGFGRGEYKYFAYPLPDVVAALRAALYPPLADVANRWNDALEIGLRFPGEHAAYLARCHKAGQTKPTPLLLAYGAGDYNCLHQDIYGEHVFPLQVAFLLSRPGEDFSGGEFVLTEQRPRMQSRAEVVPLAQGEGVIFPVHHRPVQGTRGTYRVNMRHGVSRLRSGRRHTLGIIFHDGA